MSQNVEMAAQQLDRSMSPRALLINLRSDEVFPIFDEAIIGRSRNSTIVFQEPFVSDYHFSIKHYFSRFFIKNNSDSLTHLNCEIMGKEEKELEHSDFIGIGEENNVQMIFKFILNPTPEENHGNCEDTAVFTKLGMLAMKIHCDFDIKKQELSLEVQRSTNERIAMLESRMLKFDNEPNHVEKIKDIKNLIYYELKNELKCSICNKLKIENRVANCSHIFCLRCVTDKIPAGKFDCFICSTTIATFVKCTALDTYIQKVCDLLGKKIQGSAQGNVAKRRRR